MVFQAHAFLWGGGELCHVMPKTLLFAALVPLYTRCCKRMFDVPSRGSNHDKNVFTMTRVSLTMIVV